MVFFLYLIFLLCRLSIFHKSFKTSTFFDISNFVSSLGAPPSKFHRNRSDAFQKECRMGTNVNHCGIRRNWHLPSTDIQDQPQTQTCLFPGQHGGSHPHPWHAQQLCLPLATGVWGTGRLRHDRLSNVCRLPDNGVRRTAESVPADVTAVLFPVNNACVELYVNILHAHDFANLPHGRGIESPQMFATVRRLPHVWHMQAQIL